MKFIISFIVCLFLAASARCDYISFYEENDVIWRVDGYYTQGAQLMYGHNDWGLRLAQQIYTPENKDDPNPQYGDRPYAGWSHVDWFKHINRRDGAIDIFELGFGVVGQDSGAEWAQTEVHKLIGSRPPMGWGWQLYNEPTLQLGYTRSYLIPICAYADYRPFAAGNLGNVLIDAEVGNTVRVGYNLPRRFDPVIRLSVPRGFINDLFGYLFFGIKGRLVGRNIFLDGNTFRDSYVTATKEPVVADFYLGASLGLKYLELTYTHVERTKEFTTQTRDNRFDSFQLTYNF